MTIKKISAIGAIISAILAAIIAIVQHLTATPSSAVTDSAIGSTGNIGGNVNTGTINK